MDPQGSDFAPHPVVGFVPRAEDAEKFPLALGLKSLDPFLRVSKQGTCLSAKTKKAVTRELYNFNSLAKLMALLRQNLLNLDIAAIAEAILMRVSAEQVY